MHVAGLCHSHYRRKLGGISLDTPIRKRKVNFDGDCEVPGCTRPGGNSGWCRHCMYRWRKSGGPLWTLREKQESFIDSSGYVRINKSHPLHNIYGSRQPYEHVAVMSAHVGRNLYEHENVHHINGNRSDNRIENLELWSTSQPAGQRVVDKLSWAREIISLYDDKS